MLAAALRRRPEVRFYFYLYLFFFSKICIFFFFEKIFFLRSDLNTECIPQSRMSVPSFLPFVLHFSPVVVVLLFSRSRYSGYPPRRACALTIEKKNFSTETLRVRYRSCEKGNGVRGNPPSSKLRKFSLETARPLEHSTCWMQRAARKFKPKSYNLERHAFSLREFFIAKICYSSSQLSVGLVAGCSRHATRRRVSVRAYGEEAKSLRVICSLQVCVAAI